MAVWTLKMNIIDKTDVFEFCKSENLIGFGWGLPDKNNKNNDAIMTITDYQKIKDRHGLYEKSRHLTACINALPSHFYFINFKFKSYLSMISFH